MANEKDRASFKVVPGPISRRCFSLAKFLTIGLTCTLVILVLFRYEIERAAQVARAAQAARADPGFPFPKPKSKEIYKYQLDLLPKSKEIYKCQPPLPSLFTQFPLTVADPDIRRAVIKIDALLARHAKRDDVDALSVSVVLGEKVLFAKGYGVKKANETDIGIGGTVNQDTVFRIASITKLFVTLQLLVLRDQGLVGLDDELKKFYPEFEIGTALDPHPDDDDDPRITLGSLASYLSGLPRDMNTFTLSKAEAEAYVLERLKHERLVVPPYTFPVYSNLGFSLLGNALRRAVIMANPLRAKATLAELLREEVLAPLNMSLSGYEITEAIRENLAVPHGESSAEAELDFGWQSPAGAMYSTSRDLSHLLSRVFLTNRPQLLSRRVLREWLRPLAPLPDSRTEVGLVWEITKLHPSYSLTGREPRLYSKGGNFGGYHSDLTVHPELSLGFVTLMTGYDPDSSYVMHKVLEIIGPVVEKKLVKKVRERYEGEYLAGEKNEKSSIKVKVGSDGVLVVDRLVINGTNLLSLIRSDQLALWSTGRLDEFRLAFGRSYLNSQPAIGCEPYWVTFDGIRAGDKMDGQAYDLLQFEPTGKKDRLGRTGVRVVYPALDVKLDRIS
ncbi:beta-lactamase/transpeptidase-like protein [Endogone sp. FLAS-F59071]|nr:beta-lactamase/transpeptidase-like protein [Endogone sp. FLAS-F59071]|eukprot:RUS16745.1 beta-lactamase/transpeptidase-like protein [Endogone sp. FLAS-F59071]